MPVKKIDAKITDTKDSELEAAQKLVADDAKKKAEESKAKAEADAKAAEKAERAARTPQQNLERDWPKKHKELAPYITIHGEVRSGQLIPGQQKAKKILKSYGFNVFKESGSRRKL